MHKNLTVNRISLYASLLIGFINTALVFLFGYFSGNQYNLTDGFLYLIFISLLTFFIIRYILIVFIFPRIQMIYELINDTTTPGKERKNMPSIDSNSDLGEINKEVMEWVVHRSTEIENIKKLEKYRRNFLGNISHELKTPLFSIQGYLHTLLDGGLEDKEINRRYVEKAVSNAERLQCIIDDLEVINKLEDENTLEKSEFSIKRLIEEVINDLEMVSKEKSIKLSIDSFTEHGLWVEADKNRIRQVLENLLTNSIKYGIENGSTKVKISEDKDKLKVDVIDDGIGISAKHIKHLFERFYRVDKSRSRNFGGSGLGLAIVKHILEAHQETIRVTSKKGVGSIFSFSLPKMKYSVDIA